jgi:hypothetical protein
VTKASALAVLVGEMGRTEVGWAIMRNEAHPDVSCFLFLFSDFFLSYFKFKSNLKFKLPFFKYAKKV